MTDSGLGVALRWRFSLQSGALVAVLGAPLQGLVAAVCTPLRTEAQGLCPAGPGSRAHHVGPGSLPSSHVPHLLSAHLLCWDTREGERCPVRGRIRPRGTYFLFTLFLSFYH